MSPLTERALTNSSTDVRITTDILKKGKQTDKIEGVLKTMSTPFHFHENAKMDSRGDLEASDGSC